MLATIERGDMKEYGNIFFVENLNSIGGIESFFYYLSKKYADWDITIVYVTGDPKQIKRLRERIRVIKFNRQRIKCKKAFFNLSVAIIDYVDAEEYWQIIHTDYAAQKLKPSNYPKITGYLGVSKTICEGFHAMTGNRIELCYLPVTPDEPKPIEIKLVSATRLTGEKGFARMEKLANALDAAGVNYQWTVFTDVLRKSGNPNIVLTSPKLDILDVVAEADWLVQLSDHEAYCYTVVESLMVGTPVIVTDLPVFKELGLTKKNSIKLPLDMSNIPVNAIRKPLKDFNYKPRADRWDKILAPGPSTYADDKNEPVMLKCICPYYDMQLMQDMNYGDEFETNRERADLLCYELGLCKEVID